MNVLPDCGFTRYVSEICTDMPIVLMIVSMLIQMPLVLKLHRKLDALIRQLI